MKQLILQPSMRSIIQAPSQTTTSPSISPSYSLEDTYVLELEIGPVCEGIKIFRFIREQSLCVRWLSELRVSTI